MQADTGNLRYESLCNGLVNSNLSFTSFFLEIQLAKVPSIIIHLYIIGIFLDTK